MPTFKIAHVKEQGVDLIIVPLESSFGNLMSDDQQQEILALQMAARSAGLAGTVVPVWMLAEGAWHSLRPRHGIHFSGALTCGGWRGT